MLTLVNTVASNPIKENKTGVDAEAPNGSICHPMEGFALNSLATKL